MRESERSPRTIKKAVKREQSWSACLLAGHCNLCCYRRSAELQEQTYYLKVSKILSIKITRKCWQGCKKEVPSGHMLYIMFYVPGMYSLFVHSPQGHFGKKTCQASLLHLCFLFLDADFQRIVFIAIKQITNAIIFGSFLPLF